ncbi:MAG: HEAT repeat domain-containing protein [Thermoanaerobaculia bacterium]
MADCDLLTENLPLLLTESLDPASRELTHRHIESCAACSHEWSSYKDTWALLERLPEVPIPAGAKARFLTQIAPVSGRAANVVPFRRRPATRWLAQAAAVVVIAGGAYVGGHRSRPVQLQPTAASIASVQPVAYSIAESRVLPASAMSPTIEGRPDIQNLQFVPAAAGDDKIGVGFDITSHITVTGHPNDKSMVRLLRYVLENEDRMSPSRSRAIDWVRATYSRPGADPEIAAALANVLRNDEHQGVRIKAAETLNNLGSAMPSDTRDALIEALKSDPNPAVRIKAVEALARVLRSGGELDTDALNTLRQKASQGDENVYVRVKAAEALGSIRPQ